jgi:chaperonin GroEL (HSP60 family)
LKATAFAVIFTSLFTSQAFAECKSVMGTCVKQDLVNSAPHMHSEYVDKTKVTKAAPQVATPAAATAISNNNKITAKKTNSTGVFSTMQNTAAK